MRYKPRTRPIAATLLVVASLITAVFYFLHRNTPAGTVDTLAPLPTGAPQRQQAVARKPSPVAPKEDPSVEDAPSDGGFVAYLQNKFGRTISDNHTQIKAIEKLLAYLQHFYPDDWQHRVLDFLKRMFPDRADALYAQYQKLTEYKEWLHDNRHEIMKLSGHARSEALWDARYKIFGDDAYEIWQVAMKNEQISATLDLIQHSPDARVEDKLQLYLDSVRQAYGDQANHFIEKRQTELLTQFLSVETVQHDLLALPPEQQHEKLTAMRRTLGMDEAALQRWNELDRQRDAAWDSGRQYMAQRGEIVSRYDGEEQQQRLRELQSRVFGPEAESIRTEEEAGFFRFDHRRRVGRE